MKTNFWLNDTEKTRFIKINNNNFIPFLDNTLQCARCGGLVQRPDHGWIGKCERCKTLVSFFMPTPIQLAAATCEASVLFNTGGYGSGKTTISSYMISNTLRDIKKSRAIAMAQTMDQLKKAALPELEKFFHPSEFKRKTEDAWELKNGSIIYFFASDDPQKLKTANVNIIWLIEASNEKMHLVYKEALARIRNDKGFIYERDENDNIVFETSHSGQVRPKVKQMKNFIILEANPTYGAWTNHACLQAHTIVYTTNVRGIDTLKLKAAPQREIDDFDKTYHNTNIVGLLNASVDNPLLAPDFFRNLRAERNQADYDRDVYCDITSQDGIVFEDIVKNKNKYFIEMQSIDHFNQDKVFVEAFDPGGSNVNNDPEAYLLGVLDRRFNTLMILEEHKVAGLTIEESTRTIWNIRRKWGWTQQKSFAFIADNALGRNDKRDSRQTLKNDYELRLGTRITLCNNKSIKDGVNKIKSWAENNALFFSTTLEKLWKEMVAYSIYTVIETKKGTNLTVQKQVFSDVNNHLLDALRYMIVVLEALGFHQDQHLIDYNRQTQQQPVQNDYDLSLNSKFNLKQFLPFGAAPIKNKVKKL